MIRITYIGKIALSALAVCGCWERHLSQDGGWVSASDEDLLRQKWGFNLGSMLIMGLLKRGHEVHVVSTEPEDVCGRFRCHVNGEECCRLTVTFVPESRKTRWMYLRFFWREMSGMRRVIKELRPDVCFAQWTYENAYAALTSGSPTLVAAHDSPWGVFKTFRNLQTFIKAIYATLFVVPKIRHLTAVSPYIVREFKKFKRLRNVDIPVIPNGIEIGDERVGMRNEGRGIRQTIPSPIPHSSSPIPRCPTIVSISQAGRLKNSAALFKAWEILRPKHPDWRLIVYGQGMPQGMATRDELDRVLREEADLFVSPSLEESFGMVFVEAMRFGVPCIGGEKSGAVPWVIGAEVDCGQLLVDSDTNHQSLTTNAGGVVCDVTRPDKLAECIEYVMGNVELRKKLSEGGRKRVRNMFDIEKVVDMYNNSLMRLLSSKCHKRDRQLCYKFDHICENHCQDYSKKDRISS